MNKEAKKNAYLYCKFRDEQFALYDAYAKKHGIMMKTLLVVNALFYAKQGMTQTQLCQRTFQSKQTVNLIMKKLLQDGHVRLEEDVHDHRHKLVYMTSSGRTHYEQVVRHITWAEDTAMAMLAPEEQRRLIDLARTFSENLAKLVWQKEEKE